MAGIGFRLQKILSEDSYTSIVKGYVYSAIISSGPWLMTILAVGVIGSFSNIIIGKENSDIFRVAIIYTYAFSLIFIGILQMIVTRYLADKLFMSEETLVLPIFNTAFLLTLVTQTPVAVIFYYFCKMSFFFGLIGTILYISICSMWLCMIFLGAAKDYHSIIISFIVGTVISILTAIILGNKFGIIGILAGFAAGQIFIVFRLLTRLIKEFPSNMYFDFGVLKYFGTYYELFFIGLLYNTAIWIDNFLFWFAGPGYKIKGLFYSYKIYGSSMFFAYLTIVPSLALFLIRIETSFYRSYKTYFTAIQEKSSRSKIIFEREKMAESLKLSFERLIKIQGFISIAAIIFAANIIDFFHLSYLQFSIIRIGILGAFLQVILLILCIILLYFDLRKETLICTLVFLVSNTLFTLISLKLGFRFYGYGYFSACLITLPIAYYYLNHNLNNLEYLTFMKQPIK